jgi:lysozyme family protein
MVNVDSKFEQCIKFVLDYEGRFYENNPNDPGGETKYGISKKSYPNIDIKNLTEEQAKAIYLQDYWRPLDCFQYENKTALAVFDTAVNQGVGTAQKIIAEFEGKSFTAEQYLFRRLRKYLNLVQANSKLTIWLNNWFLRVVKLTEYKFV